MKTEKLKNRKIVTILLAFAMSFTLTNCNSEDIADYTEDIEVLSDADILLSSDTLPDAFIAEETPELKALKEEFEKQKKEKSKGRSSYSYDYNLSNNFYAIRNLPFRITTSNNGINRYLSTNGKGKELTFDSYRSSRPSSRPGSRADLTQQFYVEVLPASSGIPYLLYSQQEKTLISMGYYNNDKNNYILVTRNDNNGSLFSASWDFIPSSKNDGTMYLQNQDIIGQGSSGSFWDIFNYTLQLGSNNKTTLKQYQQLASQHFTIVPDNTFALSNVKFVNAYSARVISKTKHPVIRAKQNTEKGYREMDLYFDDVVDETGIYKEDKSAIAFNVIYNNNTYKQPDVIKDNVYIVPHVDAKSVMLYKPNVNQKFPITLDGETNLWAEPRTRYEITYSYNKYDVEVQYEATATYNDRTIKFTGTWRGIIYKDELSDEQKGFKTNIDTGVSTPFTYTRTSKKTRLNL